MIGVEISSVEPAASRAPLLPNLNAGETAAPTAAHSPAGAATHDQVVSALLAKSLFFPRRRDVTAPLSGVAAHATLPRLAGTIVAATGERLALLVPDGQARALIVREGGQACGLLVLRITPGEVLAEGQTGRLTLRVAFNAAAPTAVASFVSTQDPRQHAPTDHTQ